MDPTLFSTTSQFAKQKLVDAKGLNDLIYDEDYPEGSS